MTLRSLVNLLEPSVYRREGFTKVDVYVYCEKVSRMVLSEAQDLILPLKK